MKKITILIFMIFSFFKNSYANYDQLAYEFSFDGIDGKEILLKDYENRVLVVVNVASRCGFTPQYEKLQSLWNNYKDKNVVVIGVPSNDFKQEPASNSEIKEFCETSFGIDFPITKKTSVKGNMAHPFYKWAQKNYGNSAVPKWNFHKIIIGKSGKVIDTFSSITKPTSQKIINIIEREIKN